MTSVLPIEHAWRLIADGLHIHRFYLHLAEHLDADGQPLDTKTLRTLLPGRKSSPHRTIAFGSGQIEVVPVQYRPSGAMLPFEESPSAPYDPALVRDGMALLQESGLSYLPELAVRVVLEVQPSPGAARLAVQPHRAPLHAMLPRTIVIAAAASSLDWAESLVAAAAAQLLYLFFTVNRAAGESAAHATVTLDWLASEYEPVVLTFADAVRLRLLETVASGDIAVTPEVAALASTRAEMLAAKVQAGVRDAYAIIDRIADVRIVDLLQVSIPGPRQFAKFAGGGGPGQSE